MQSISDIKVNLNLNENPEKANLAEFCCSAVKCHVNVKWTVRMQSGLSTLRLIMLISCSNRS